MYALAKEHVLPVLMSAPADATRVHHEELDHTAAPMTGQGLKQQALVQVPVPLDDFQVLYSPYAVLVADQVVFIKGTIGWSLLLRGH